MDDDDDETGPHCPICGEAIDEDNQPEPCDECDRMGCQACVFDGVCDSCDDPHDQEVDD